MKKESIRFEQEMKNVMVASRTLAIEIKNGFICLEHLFVAMLKTDSIAKSYLMDFGTEEQIVWLHELYLHFPSVVLKDAIPLTIQSERVVMHAVDIARTNKQTETNSVHLLLSMLSYENSISELLMKKGLVYEDIASKYFTCNTPKAPIQLKLSSFKFNPITSFFRLSPSRNKLANEICKHATNLWSFQQYDDCITVCKNGLDIIDDYSDLKSLLACCFFRKDNFDGAIEIFQLLAMKFPENIYYQFTLANCYERVGQFLKSGEILDKILENDPNNTIALNNRGFNLYLQEKYGEAAPFYEKAIQLDPSFAYPWNNLGFIKYKLGETELGLSLIEKGLQLDKGNAYAYKYKGIILMEQQNIVLAQECFQLALKYGYTKKYGDEVLQLIKRSSPSINENQKL